MKLLYEKIFKRILIESLSETKTLAAFVEEYETIKSAVIYEVQNLEDYLRSDDKENQILNDVIARSIKGYIVIKEPEYESAGAWEVRSSAGPKNGQIVYGVGFALSPNGKLMPSRKNKDQGSISDDAFRGWAKQQDKRASIPLDNALPNIKKGEKQRTPEDVSDDAEVWSWKKVKNSDTWIGDDIVDRAYESQGWEKKFLNSLKANHQNLLDLAAQNGVPKEVLESVLKRKAAGYFADSSISPGIQRGPTWQKSAGRTKIFNRIKSDKKS